MQTKNRFFIQILFIMLITYGPVSAFAQTSETTLATTCPWQYSLQYLGLTWHPDGGGNPQVYPLKLDKKAYLVLSVGAAANIDYRFSKRFFFRFTTTLYKDCAFLTAGCLHAGPRVQFSHGRSSLNVGIGPILSYRRDWHRFAEYQDDEFYGNRIYKGWQYRFYGTALELEYLYRLNNSAELQWSVIPGVPLVITSMFGVRFKLDGPGKKQ